MYYFRKVDGVIRKYELKFDCKQLQELNERIKRECRQIEHHSYMGMEGPYVGCENRQIVNLQSTFIKEVEPPLGAAAIYRAFYQFDYDEIIYPELVSVIERLIAGTVRQEDIDVIFAKDRVALLSMDEVKMKMELLSQEIDSISNFDFEKKKEKLDELANLVSSTKRTDLEEKLYLFQCELRRCIDLVLVGSLDEEIVNQVDVFFDGGKNDKIVKLKKR